MNAHASSGPRRRAAVAVLVALGLLLAAPAAARPGARSQSCGATVGLVCSEVDVPLDRTGHVPGIVSLHVEMLPALGTPRGAIFLVAGGPGQGSARAFGLGTVENATFYRILFPGYTLVTYDDRGTGASGLLDCPALDAVVNASAAPGAAAACATLLGPARSFYSTADHAADLEAVRRALGFDRIAIWGVSYGTKLALAYAQAHPDHVERLLLDSVVAPGSHDTFGTDVLQSMPATLSAYCPGATCRGATPDFAGDVAAVGNMLATAPLVGNVVAPNGGPDPQRLEAVDFLGLVVGADLDPGLAAELPAAVHAARGGYPQPLLHLFQLQNLAGAEPAAEMSSALYLATVCRDGPFPWLPDTPAGQRGAALQSALAALPAAAFGPFGSWAHGIGNAELCLDWPSPAGGAEPAPAPLPNVPVLVLSGGLDLRTPTSGGAAVAASFPQGHLLVVPGVGHSVLTADPSGCSQLAVRRWMLDGTAPATCARAKAFLAPLAAFPRPGAKRLDAKGTLAVARKTLRESEAVWLMRLTSSNRQAPAPGLAGGRLAAGERSVTLSRYALVPGVTVSGRLSVTALGPPVVFTGSVTVAGRSAAAGTLRLTASGLVGRLGHTAVHG